MRCPRFGNDDEGADDLARARPLESARATCGTMSPTKPTSPATATAAPPSIPEAAIATARVRTGSAPRLEATRSPRDSTLSLPVTERARAAPTAMKGSAGTTSCQPRLAKLPPMKCRDCTLKTRACARIPVATAAASAEMETPMSARRAGDIPCREANTAIAPAPIRDAATESENNPQVPICTRPAMARA